MSATVINLDGSPYIGRAWCEECQQGHTGGITGAHRWAATHDQENHPERNPKMDTGQLVQYLPRLEPGWTWHLRGTADPENLMTLDLTCGQVWTLTAGTAGTVEAVQSAAARLLGRVSLGPYMESPFEWQPFPSDPVPSATAILPPPPDGWEWEVAQPGAPQWDMLRVTLHNTKARRTLNVHAGPTPGAVKAAAALLVSHIDDPAGPITQPDAVKRGW